MEAKERRKEDKEGWQERSQKAKKKEGQGSKGQNTRSKKKGR